MKDGNFAQKIKVFAKEKKNQANFEFQVWIPLLTPAIKLIINGHNATKHCFHCFVIKINRLSNNTTTMLKENFYELKRKIVNLKTNLTFCMLENN